jgi:hypothetical protein
MKPTRDQVYQAAIRWCGQKDRETFSGDVDYFCQNWWVSLGMEAVVDQVVAEQAAQALASHT